MTNRFVSYQFHLNVVGESKIKSEIGNQQFNEQIKQNKIIKDSELNLLNTKSIQSSPNQIQNIINNQSNDNYDEIDENIYQGIKSMTEYEKNLFDDLNVSELGQTLAKCTNLQNLILNLSDNKISAIGASNLGSSIANCTNLQNLKLYLNNNEIGTIGASGLVSALAKFTNLSELTLNLEQKQFIGFRS
ncbi:hypothetical protein TTHERM_00612580 (macronuclear) [Tetrahymena thermophila SB210]|uniref:Kinase domain protein n=1 Tax=Tetrahymena thermophila (strain SB210) TaxID=312017 RepID=Q22YC8_TETTS|nr:hypothetical protein TTHERM_00612580 [Tetrahymena thermophila SB210]EAR90357.2 hypothetical protein TTHERM_00612580 [Tetrahymena thermophila SB210]|eukprot:XP_001010602.2 hypothetical protein TTHERM_00612580 [Tetrahymena thermophila SB210]